MKSLISFIIVFIVFLLMVIYMGFIIHDFKVKQNIAKELCEEKELNYISNTVTYYTCADSDGITRTFKYKEDNNG